MLAITVAAKGRMADVLDAGADDYLHRPFTRAELIARARAGLRAAEQRANDRLLRTLMENVPGAIYRSAWHADFILEAISDEIERISGYPPANFLSSNKRTLLSIVHPDDVDVVLEAVAESTDHREAFVLEYRIVRADGDVRWVLDRGQPVPGPGGRLWLDGALFDITERRAAEQALLAHKVEAARTAELRASRQRILEAADAARRKIERDLHDGAQQRLVSLVLDVQVARRRLAQDPSGMVPFLERLGTELQEASAELRELARHPSGRADRARAGGRDRRARDPLADPGRGRRPAEPALPAGDRGDGVLHGRRGADQRRQVRAGLARRGQARLRGRRAGGRGLRRRRRRRVDRVGLRAQRARRPRRRQRRHAQRRQRPRLRHLRAGGASSQRDGLDGPQVGVFVDPTATCARRAIPVAEGAACRGRAREGPARDVRAPRQGGHDDLDVPLADDGLSELAGRLKKRCGVGGSVKDGVIELQGDHRTVVMEVLRADGYDVVAAGG